MPRRRENLKVLLATANLYLKWTLNRSEQVKNTSELLNMADIKSPEIFIKKNSQIFFGLISSLRRANYVAKIEEMEGVIPYLFSRYKDVLTNCKGYPLTAVTPGPGHGPYICHSICSCVYIYKRERIAPNDVSISNSINL